MFGLLNEVLRIDNHTLGGSILLPYVVRFRVKFIRSSNHLRRLRQEVIPTGYPWLTRSNGLFVRIVSSMN